MDSFFPKFLCDRIEESAIMCVNGNRQIFTQAFNRLASIKAEHFTVNYPHLNVRAPYESIIASITNEAVYRSKSIPFE